MAEPVCGNSGIPLDPPKRVTPDQMGGPGSDYKKPGEGIDRASYIKEADVYVPKDGSYPTGIAFPKDNKWVFYDYHNDTSIPFDNRLELHEWARGKGYNTTAKAKVDTRKISYEMGYIASQGMHLWSAKAPWQRVLGMMYTNFNTNLGTTAQGIRAMEWAHGLASQDRWATLFDAFAGRKDLSIHQLNALLPQNKYVRGAMKWALNGAEWARSNIVDQFHVFDLEQLRTGTIEETAANKERLIYLKSKLDAALTGEESLPWRAQRELNRVLKERGLDINNVVGKYRMAHFTLERSNRLESEFRKEVNTLLKNKGSLFTDKAGNIHKVDELYAPEDINQPWDAVHSRFADAFADTDEAGRLFDTYANRHNPTQFTWNGLEGKEAARAYLDSLTPEEHANFEAANAVADRFYDELHKQAADAGVGGLTRAIVEERQKLEPHYIPLAEDMDRVARANPFITRGRRTAVDNPAQRYFDYLTAMNRNVQKNMFAQHVFQTLQEASANGVSLFQIGKEKLVRSKEGEKLWKPVKELEKHEAGVWFPPTEEGGEPHFFRISFEANSGGINGERASLLKSIFTQTSRDSGLFDNPAFNFVAASTNWLSGMWTFATPMWIPKSLCWNLGVTPFSTQSAFGLSTGDWKKFFLGDHDTMKPYMYHVVDVAKGQLSNKHLEANPKLKAFMTFASEEGAGYGSGDTRFEPVNDINRSIAGGTGTLLERLQQNPVETARFTVRDVQQGIKHFAHTPDTSFSIGAFKAAIEMKAHERGVELNTLADFRNFKEQFPEDVAWAANGSRKILPNFTAHGSFRSLNAFLPFFNATVQTGPMMVRLAKTPTGKAGMGLAFMLGFWGYHQAHEEFGDEAENMTNQQGTFYLGNHVSIPADYAWHPFMEMGRQLARMSAGKADINDAIIESTKALANSISPVEMPEESQSWGGWALSTITPAALKAPEEWLTHLDRYGHTTYNEKPVDEYGNALVHPAGYQMGKPGDSAWATRLAKFAYNASGHLLNLVPADVSTAFQNYAPFISTFLDAFEGKTQTRMGNESPNILTGLAKTVGGQFYSEPTMSGGEREARRFYNDHVTSSDTRMTLLANPKTAAFQQLMSEGQKFARSVTIGTVAGPLNKAKIDQHLAIAKQKGDVGQIQYWQAKDAQIRARTNAYWYSISQRMNFYRDEDEDED